MTILELPDFPECSKSCKLPYDTEWLYTQFMQGSKQTMAWHQLAQQICFAVSSLEETHVKGVNLANCSGGEVQKTLLFKGSKMKFHPTPWMPRWAGRLVVLTQAKQLGKCQEPFFWEQEVHLVKTAGFILCTLIMFQVSVFKKTLFKAFRFTSLTENYVPCNIWRMKL